GVEGHEVRDAPLADAEEPGDRLAAQDSGALDQLVVLALPEDHVEGDAVHAGVLAADRLGEVGQAPRRRARAGGGGARGVSGHGATWAGRRSRSSAPVTSVVWSSNSSSGSSTRSVWFSVHL